MNGSMRKRHQGHNAGHAGGHPGGMGQNNNRRMHPKYAGKSQGGTDRYGQPRQRKNYGALREKYINHAKEAMSSGDRVLAEYYLQHADHYYRMMMEVQEQRARWQEQAQAAGEAVAESEAENTLPEDEEPEVDIPNNSNVLPAFLTRKVEKEKPDDNVIPMQEWEDEQH